LKHPQSLRGLCGVWEGLLALKAFIEIQWSCFMGPWLDSVTGWLATNPQWLAAAVFIVAFVECLAIAGLIVPGTVLLFAVAVLAGSGALSPRRAYNLTGRNRHVACARASPLKPLFQAA